MINGLWGKKIGMTQLFTEQGKVVPVTVIDLADWLVTQVKTVARDGYSAVQFGRLKSRHAASEFKAEWLSDPKMYFSVLKEVSVADDSHSFLVGHKADVAAVLNQGDNVDVTGITIGRGFQGGVKRHGFTGGRGSHGCKLGRKPGSIGYMRSRGRVIKGWRMAGHMGTDTCMMKNLKVIRVEPESQVIMVKGSVPGKVGSLVYMRKCR